MSKQELQKTYFATAIVFEVEDIQQAKDMQAGMGSASWGAGPVEGTEWTLLKTLSPWTPGEKKRIFVCKTELLR